MMGETLTPPNPDPHAWLQTKPARLASDIALGLILLAVGALFYWSASAQGGYNVDEYGAPNAWFYPSIVSGLLCAVAVLLLLRAVLGWSPPTVRKTRPLHALIAGTIIVAYFLTLWMLSTTDSTFFLRFGPLELLTLILFHLSVPIALAHSSRLRAFGMALLGLLICTMGLDPASGELRFAFGFMELLKGIDPAVVLAGLFIAGDALLCLGSVNLYLHSYVRLFSKFQLPRIPVLGAIVMRVVAALVLGAMCWFAYTLSLSDIDIAWLFAFGIIGAAGKIFGWNRFLLYMGFTSGAMLEEYLRMTMLVSNGDLASGLNWLNETLLALAAAFLLGGAALSVWRALGPSER